MTDPLQEAEEDQAEPDVGLVGAARVPLITMFVLLGITGGLLIMVKAPVEVAFGVGLAITAGCCFEGDRRIRNSKI